MLQPAQYCLHPHDSLSEQNHHMLYSAEYKWAFDSAHWQMPKDGSLFVPQAAYTTIAGDEHAPTQPLRWKTSAGSAANEAPEQQQASAMVHTACCSLARSVAMVLSHFCTCRAEHGAAAEC